MGRFARGWQRVKTFFVKKYFDLRFGGRIKVPKMTDAQRRADWFLTHGTAMDYPAAPEPRRETQQQKPQEQRGQQGQAAKAGERTPQQTEIRATKTREIVPPAVGIRAKREEFAKLIQEGASAIDRVEGQHLVPGMPLSERELKNLSETRDNLTAISTALLARKPLTEETQRELRHVQSLIRRIDATLQNN